MFFFFQAEDGIRDIGVTGVQTCALPISTGVATRTSLTVSQASEVLDRLAGRGHLEVTAEEGALVYSLREGDRPVLEGPESPPGAPGTDEAPPGAGLPVEPLEEPLSERELEVLALLASGKTSREA